VKVIPESCSAQRIRFHNSKACIYIVTNAGFRTNGGPVLVKFWGPLLGTWRR